MVEEIDFENRHFWNFKYHVTFTLTSDDIESHIVVNISPTLTNTTFDELYDVMLSLLDHFYPERSIIGADFSYWVPGQNWKHFKTNLCL